MSEKEREPLSKRKKEDPKLASLIQRCVCYGLTAIAVILFALICYFCIERISGLRRFVGTVINALMPIVWGIVFAYLLSPVYNELHRRLYGSLSGRTREKTAKSWSKGLSIALSLLLLIAVLYALVAMVVPRLIENLVMFANNIPRYVRQMRSGLYTLLEDYPEAQSAVMSVFNSAAISGQSWVNGHLENFNDLSNESIQELLKEAWSFITSISAGVWSVINFFKNLLIGLIVSVYVLASKQRMCGQGKKLIYAIFPRRAANVILENCRFAHHAMSGFISGKILDSLIIGVLCFVLSSILQIPYALLVSVIVGVTNVIPFFGPYFGAIPSAIFILFVDPMKCLVFLVMIILLQQFDGNILGPRILGSSTGLNSFWVIFSLLLFGGLFGIPGMIIGVPIWSVIYHIFDEISAAVLKKKKLSAKTEDYELLGEIQGGEYRKVPDPALVPDNEKAIERAERWKKIKRQISSFVSPQDTQQSDEEMPQPPAEQDAVADLETSEENTVDPFDE